MGYKLAFSYRGRTSPEKGGCDRYNWKPIKTGFSTSHNLFYSLLCKVHTTAYPTGLVLTIKKENPLNCIQSSFLSAGAPTKGSSNWYKFVKC